MCYKRFIILASIFLIIVLNAKPTYCEDSEEILENQQESFGISSFIEKSKQYSNDIFENIDISKIFNSAIKGDVDNKFLYKQITKIIGKEVQSSLKGLVSILIIVVIHSILKSISDSLENENISKMIFYVQYILIVTIIMSNFSDVINLVKETTTNLTSYINILIPLLVSLMIYTGSITTTSILQPLILFIINLIGNLVQDLLIPLILIITSISIISKISDKVQIEKFSKFLKSGTVWVLGVVLTVFVGVVSLEGTLASSVDGITAKTAKAIVSSGIPVVGKVLGDVIDSVLGCGVILKNAVGFVGVIVILGICILPIIKLSILTISYKLVAALCEVVADEKIVNLLDEISDIFKVLLAIVISISFMVIIGVTVLIKMSNIGMMYK